MNGILIVDTSTWIDFFSGKTFFNLEHALKEGRVWVPPLVIAELLSGQLSPQERQNMTSFLEQLHLCVADFQHFARVGQLRSTLIQKGMTISTPDAHVAQCALDLGGYLMSSDKMFAKIAAAIRLELV